MEGVSMVLLSRDVRPMLDAYNQHISLKTWGKRKKEGRGMGAGGAIYYKSNSCHCEAMREHQPACTSQPAVPDLPLSKRMSPGRRINFLRLSLLVCRMGENNSTYLKVVIQKLNEFAYANPLEDR